MSWFSGACRRSGAKSEAASLYRGKVCGTWIKKGLRDQRPVGLLAAQAWPKRETELEPGVSASLCHSAISGPGPPTPREAPARRKAATGSPAPKLRPQEGGLCQQTKRGPSPSHEPRTSASPSRGHRQGLFPCRRVAWSSCCGLNSRPNSSKTFASSIGCWPWQNTSPSCCYRPRPHAF